MLLGGDHIHVNKYRHTYQHKDNIYIYIFKDKDKYKYENKFQDKYKYKYIYVFMCVQTCVIRNPKSLHIYAVNFVVMGSLIDSLFSIRFGVGTELPSCQRLG